MKLFQHFQEQPLPDLQNVHDILHCTILVTRFEDMLRIS
jgi:hypothetical protein